MGTRSPVRRDAEASETDAPDDTPTAQPALGLALRRLRQDRGVALTAVSRETGISVSFLSVVENGKSDITIGRLMRLLAFYGARLGDLLPGERQRERLVTRAEERILLQSPTEGVELSLLAPDTDRAMMPVMGVHKPGSRLTDLRAHEGETFIHLLEGTLLFEREGHPHFVLSAGDSAYITGDRPPTITTVGDAQARLIAVVTPPIL